METYRKRNRTLESVGVPYLVGINGQTTETEKTTSLYEQSRDKRIKENLERMQKLGIVDLSLHLKTLVPSKLASKSSSSAKRTCPQISPMTPPVPTRRSSRLQSATPVNYSEVVMAKKDVSLECDEGLIEEGGKPELYTEEHEKLLGDCNSSWTLFVDGYGKDGRRIYDQVKGKTCHQCRQKTLGHRTRCSKCTMVQGQFCGDCLYMRYGENVLEAKQNPNWICPPCRGICNCSFCRQAKGWPATGTLYRKVKQLGYKSVAHYLIQTRRAQTNLENSTPTKTPVSAKRPLSFSRTDVESEEPSKAEWSGRLVLGGESPVKDRRDDEAKSLKKNEILLEEGNGKGHIAREHSVESKENFAFSTETNPENCADEKNMLSSLPEGELEANMKLSENKQFVDGDWSAATEGDGNKEKLDPVTPPSPESIAGRLKVSRSKSSKGFQRDVLTVEYESVLGY